jgi:two-component system OmpR family sensor kinase
VRGALAATRVRRIGSAGRLAAFHAIVLFLALGIVTVALVRSFSMSFEAAAAAEIGGQIRQFEQAAVTRAPSESVRSFSVRFLETHPLGAGDTLVVAILGAGLVVTGNSSRLVHDARIAAWFVRPPQTTQSFSVTIDGTPLEIVASPISSGDTVIGTYIESSDLQPFVAERSRVLALSLAEAGVALLVGVASAFFLLRRLLRTVGKITQTAEEIGSGDLGQRLGDQGSNDEVAELARTFDAMLDHLDAAMTSQRRLLSDVSHQLRSPLTVVRGHLEVLARTGTSDREAVRETLVLVIDELDHMTILVERLLMLGRAMEPDLLDRSLVDLPELLSSIIESVAVIAPRRFILAPTLPSVVSADREQLRGAIVNLIENAIHATTVDDQIALGAYAEPGTELVRVVVEDSGGGIPLSEREAALQRFARPGARDAGGSGLGLAIAKAVATAHGGSISIDQSPVLGGARVAMIIPRAKVPSAAAQ